MALSKGKKVLIAIVGAVVTIGAVIGTVFAVKKIKENVEMTDRPGITTPVDPTPDTPVDPTPDDPVDPTPDDPVDPDPDTPVDPNPGEEEPETPEMSEEDYRIQNVELLKEILASEYEEFSKKGIASYKLENVDNIILNTAAGEVYFTADVRMMANDTIDMGLIEGCNITGYLGESFDWQSQEELNKFLISFKDSNSDMEFENYKEGMSSKISGETYKEFIDYVKEQSYDGVDLSSIPNENFFGVTWFDLDYDALGNRYIEYNVVDGDKVYTLHAENVQPGGVGDGVIKAFMKYTNTVFKVVDVQPFEKFDLETPIIESSAQASVDLSLDFRGTTFDEISSTEFASAFFDDSRVSSVHIQYENQDGKEQRGVLVRVGKGGGGENKNTESDKINNMSMLF